MFFKISSASTKYDKKKHSPSEKKVDSRQERAAACTRQVSSGANGEAGAILARDRAFAAQDCWATGKGWTAGKGFQGS